MRAEELARQGVLGKDLEASIRGADDAFKQSVKTTAQSLAGKGTEETSDDTLTKAIGLVKTDLTHRKNYKTNLWLPETTRLQKKSLCRLHKRNIRRSITGN